MKVLIIDNYDSFTYNLYQFVGEVLGAAINSGKLSAFDIIVKRNDALTLAQIQSISPERIIISPGPGSPDDTNYFGVCAEVIAELGQTTPLLGVCLGMQGIVHVFGGEIVKAKLPMHGKTSAITHNRNGLFRNIPDQLDVMRYHSLIARPESLPSCLEITASIDNTQRGDMEIMAVQHKTLPIYGIQFHPESFATEGGKELIGNFLFQDECANNR